jgi:triacylglycerol esterase/lipase EstA (alpha/beta hydrolase family)
MAAKRFHIVLIPGFAGFDALGQLEYYGRVTPLFQRLQIKDLVLHYFDNLPTASVTTRASRLQSYLAKRIARGEISDGDEVTLVGHSTGGLDSPFPVGAAPPQATDQG